MPIERVDITDAEFEETIFAGLIAHGFDPSRHDDIIRLSGVGVGEGNSSVDIELNLVHLDGHRILEIAAPLRMSPVSFDTANVMSAQGNISCHLAKFRPIEKVGLGMHTVQASFVLFADHLSNEELASMLYLFIKEVDAIDDEILLIASQAKTSND